MGIRSVLCCGTSCVVSYRLAVTVYCINWCGVGDSVGVLLVCIVVLYEGGGLTFLLSPGATFGVVEVFGERICRDHRWRKRAVLACT